MIFIPHPAQRQKAALTERQKPFFRSFPIVVPTASLKQAWIGRNRVQLRYSRSFRLHFLCLDTLNKLYLQINYALSLHHFKSRSIHRASQVQNPFPITPATGQEKSIVTCRKGRTESLPARTGGLWSRGQAQAPLSFVIALPQHPPSVAQRILAWANSLHTAWPSKSKLRPHDTTWLLKFFKSINRKWNIFVFYTNESDHLLRCNSSSI